MNISSAGDWINTFLGHMIQEKRIPGIQYVVVNRSERLSEFYGGWQDIKNNLPVTDKTTFMASSSSKVITAAAVLQLIEAGKIDLDQSLSAYIPNHPYGVDVTIRNLLNQTSGIPNPLPLKWLHRTIDHPAFDEDQALAKVLAKNPRLAFTPGSRYAYSNISYWLLGKVIERVSEQRYCDYLRQHLLDPLGISQGALSCVIQDSKQQATGYLKKFSQWGFLLPLMMDKSLIGETEQGWSSLAPVYMNGPAYGGLIGTAHGFSRFLQDQLQEKPVLFKPETRALFFSKQSDLLGREIVTTLGWHQGHLSKFPYYGKPGGGPGFQSNLRIYPGLGIATTWLVNMTGVSENQINQFTDKLDQLIIHAYTL